MASSTPLLHPSCGFLGGSPNISCHEQFWNGKLDSSSWTSSLERSLFVALTRRGEPWQGLSGYHRCQWRDQLVLEHHHLLLKSVLPLPLGPLRPSAGAQAAAAGSRGTGAWPACTVTWRENRAPGESLQVAYFIQPLPGVWKLPHTSAPPPEQTQSKKILFLIEKTFPAKVSVSVFEKLDL